MQIYPGSPWENGYNERFNGTLRKEVLNAAKVNFVRIADLWDYNSEWLLRAHSHKCCAVANDRFAGPGA
jgi:transposase InsO family protein